MKIHYLLSGNDAVIGLPVYLTVMAVILSVGVFLLSSALNAMDREGERQLCEQGIDRVVNEASHLYAYADNGVMATVTIDIPNSVRVLVFGGLPSNGSQILHDSGTSENYYYVLDDGSLWTSHIQARLCGQNISCPAVFTPGQYQLSLMVLSTAEGPYVAIQE
jgi:hypothetical protein